MNDTLPPPTGLNEIHPFLATSKFLIPLSLTAILPNIAPLIWHLRSRNIATSSCLLWILLLNTINLLNAIIWSTDDMPSWWHGKILCDVEVRLIVAGGFGGLTGATLCLARSLARLLDTKRTKIGGEGRKVWVEEVLICWAPPVWMAVVLYAVQNLRYAIAAGYGCTPEVDSSWMSVVLLYIWPVVFMVVTCYYTGMIIYRLRAYRSQVASLLAQSKTSRSRFIRLFVLALLLSSVLLVASLTQLIVFVTGPMTPYSWKEVHEDWNYARLLPNGQAWGIHAGRWCWIAFGWMSFPTLGMGDEVCRKYREGFAKTGLDRILCLGRGGSSLGPTNADQRSSWLSSLGSRAKLLFNRNSESSGPFTTLESPTSARFSKLSTSSKPSLTLLSITEPKPAATKTSKWRLFSRMPSTFGQALAGVPLPPVDTSRKTTRDAASRILITLPSPTIGGLNDDLILQMVGGEPARKPGKQGPEMQDVGKDRVDP